MSDALINEFVSFCPVAERDGYPVLVPIDSTQLSAVITKAGHDGIPLSITGAETMFSPLRSKCVVVSTSGITLPCRVDGGDFVTVAGAGVAIDGLVSEAKEHGFLLPADTLYGGRATIGGAFMSGRYGASAYLSRTLNDAVIGVRAIDATGAIITGGGRTAKNVTGYELTRFLAGTMGLFAVVFELTIKSTTFPKQRMIVDARIGCERVSARLIGALMAHADSGSFFEIRYSVGDFAAISLGFEGIESITDNKAAATIETLLSFGAKGIRTITFDVFEAERAANVGQMGARLAVTVSLPPAAVGVFIERMKTITSVRPVLVHPLAGIVHYAAIDNQTLLGRSADISRSLGGKFPVQFTSLPVRGIGHLFSSSELSVVMKLKKTLDPKNILNPHLLISGDR